VYRNFCSGGTRRRLHTRQYFSDENGRKCDAVRLRIEAWKKAGQLTENEYHYLIACLLEAIDKVANTASIYGAFLKHLKISATKPLGLEAIPVIASGRRHQAMNEEGADLASRVRCDVLYLDPPYNQRQYGANYHVLETIARYDDPVVRGVTGLRCYTDQKSDFCSRRGAHKALRRVVEGTSASNVFLSYNSEGLMSRDEILETMSGFGKVRVRKRDYPRFRADADGANRVYKADRVTEYLFCLTKR